MFDTEIYKQAQKTAEGYAIANFSQFAEMFPNATLADVNDRSVGHKFTESTGELISVLVSFNPEIGWYRITDLDKSTPAIEFRAARELTAEDAEKLGIKTF